jgi:hypothetical protein
MKYARGRPNKQLCKNPDDGDAADQRNVGVIETTDAAVSQRGFR